MRTSEGRDVSVSAVLNSNHPLRGGLLPFQGDWAMTDPGRPTSKVEWSLYQGDSPSGFPLFTPERDSERFVTSTLGKSKTREGSIGRRDSL